MANKDSFIFPFSIQYQVVSGSAQFMDGQIQNWFSGRLGAGSSREEVAACGRCAAVHVCQLKQNGVHQIKFPDGADPAHSRWPSLCDKAALANCAKLDAKSFSILSNMHKDITDHQSSSKPEETCKHLNFFLLLLLF